MTMTNRLKILEIL